jgi:hypothetical protein
MSILFKKLNLKTQPIVHVLNAPDSLAGELAALTAELRTALEPEETTTFMLFFATTQEELDRLSRIAAAAALGDAIVWAAYPKASSKKYRCEFNRDSGWSELGAAGFEPVRQVAVDQDWSALRFRRVERIKSFTRRKSMALSAEGKKRAQKA